LLAFASGALSAFVLFGIPPRLDGGSGAGSTGIDLDATGFAISSGLCLL
jgi:hypothetical protein